MDRTSARVLSVSKITGSDLTSILSLNKIKKITFRRTEGFETQNVRPTNHTMISNQPWWLSGLMSQSNKSRIAQKVPGSNPVQDLEMLNMFEIKNEYMSAVFPILHIVLTVNS